MFARIKGRVRYNIRSMFLSTKNKSVMLQIITLEEKTKVSYYILLREKQKYHITSRSSKLLKTAFSCGLCYSDRRIVLSYCEKRKVNYFFFKNKRASTFNTFNEQQVSCYKYLHCRGKTKVSYYITFFQTFLKTFFRGLCYSDRRIILSYCEKGKLIMFARRTKGRVHYNTFNE